MNPGSDGPYYEHECPMCEYVMSFAQNDWYVCSEQRVVLRHGDDPDDHMTVTIEQAEEMDGMMSQAKSVVKLWKHYKEIGHLPPLLIH